MKTCATCKWWDAPRPDTYGFGDCNQIPDGEPTTLAYTWDYEDYRSGFRTKPEFGCVLHEEAGDEAPRDSAV